MTSWDDITRAVGSAAAGRSDSARQEFQLTGVTTPVIQSRRIIA
ncbi:hypothetical protein KEM60_02685 [Austwickia sp. TVS 96-490-7B]|nr:hypothetical protein [Austwickia sp. TVS 96-490-7B]